MDHGNLSRINGATRLVGVIGWPVAHSLSPRMHNGAFGALGLNWAYVPMPVPPGRVADALRGLAALGFAGANVTVPHKTAAAAAVDDLTPIVRATGAANTIVVRPDGSLLGDSTDGAGFLADLQRHHVAIGPATTVEGLACRRAVVLGAGGAARSIVYALAEAGVEVVILNRTAARAEALCSDIVRALPAARVAAGRFPADLAGHAAEADLAVNATSLGLHEHDALPWDLSVPFRPGQVVYDLIYNRSTEFLALAESQGARAIDGLGMLICQGARSAALWTGHDERELAELMERETSVYVKEQHRV